MNYYRSISTLTIFTRVASYWSALGLMALTLLLNACSIISNAATLPGTKGPLYEYVGKTDAKVTGADVGANIGELNSNSPPKARTLPSGTETIYIDVKFEKAPEARSLSVDIYNNNGQVDTERGLTVTEVNNKTGEYIVHMIVRPKAGKFDDSSYQARVKLDDEVVTLINWQIGERET